MADTNVLVAGLLRDLASVQTNVQSKWGYKRAASAVMNLDVPIEQLRHADGTLGKIRHVGPASARIVHEVLDLRRSPTVEAAVASSAKPFDIEKRHHWRQNFLSRAGVLAALRADLPGAVHLTDCRADFQMHSTWSDGAETIEKLVEGCLARHYTHCLLTDHAHGLRIARGIGREDLDEQHAEIDRVNRRHEGRFRVIRGIEANILKDGSLDTSLDDLRGIEIVMAAPHAVLRIEADQTDRMLAAIDHPRLRILGHGRGRMFGSRPGITADWRRVFARAAERGVAIEIDGDPSRQDVDFLLARQALEAGCLIALSSDAHAASDLRFIDIALAHARLAGIPADRVINTWHLDRLLTWASSTSDSLVSNVL